ncbi:MAG: hypothetical protein ABIR92_02335 [Gemmatimonadaceae bacterium]
MSARGDTVGPGDAATRNSLVNSIEGRPVYIAISWIPLAGISAADVASDIDLALDPDDFEIAYSPFEGLHMANVKSENLGAIRDLGQTLIPLSDERFEFVMSYVPNGNYMYFSGNVDGVRCDTLSQY